MYFTLKLALVHYSFTFYEENQFIIRNKNNTKVLFRSSTSFRCSFHNTTPSGKGAHVAGLFRLRANFELTERAYGRRRVAIE